MISPNEDFQIQPRSNPNDRFKRGSVRGLQAVLLNSGLGSSNNSFVDGRVSPSPSFATSAHEVKLFFFFLATSETQICLGNV